MYNAVELVERNPLLLLMKSMAGMAAMRMFTTPWRLGWCEMQSVRWRS